MSRSWQLLLGKPTKEVGAERIACGVTARTRISRRRNLYGHRVHMNLMLVGHDAEDPLTRGALTRPRLVEHHMQVWALCKWSFAGD